jgi:lipid A disaccharide synthetase
MKYYLIAGEASGDMHAANLMAALVEKDPKAEFRFLGGDKMAAIGGTPLIHYKKMAYMGILPVILHARTLLRNMRICKKDILSWQPDVLILIDYPGFNLNIAAYIKKATRSPHTLLYIAQTLGLERLPHTQHPPRHRPTVLHTPFRKSLFRPEKLPGLLCG